MNILFLTITKIRDPKQHTLYADLMREFARNGHDVYIFSPVEKKENYISIITCFSSFTACRMYSICKNRR